MNALSLCMIVKNEERILPGCLDSVRGLPGECIIVDTGSTDETPRIAASYGAKVVPFDFAFVDFAAARNRAIACASGRWILVLDADETLDRASAPLIEELVALDRNAGYFLERYNHSSDAPEPILDYAVRLFPNRRAIDTAGASTKLSMPRFSLEEDGYKRQASGSITLFPQTAKRGAVRTTGIFRS